MDQHLITLPFAIVPMEYDRETVRSSKIESVASCVSRRTFFPASWALLFSLLFLTTPVFSDSNEEWGADNPPNFLIILADDMGYSDAGAYGGEIETPHLDQLASNGLRYTRFYNTGRCWPTRTSILTGYYPQQVGMDPVRSGQLDQMPDWAHMLPDYLSSLNYRSYHSGKWHIHLENNPVGNGHFDRSYRVADHNRFFHPQKHYLDDERLQPVSPEDDFYVTTEIAGRAIEFLQQHERNHEDQPWMTYLAFTSPHFPLHAPQEDIKEYDGIYEKGWDKIRRNRFQRMKNMGIIPDHLSLPSREPDVVPGWNMWSKDLKHVFGPREKRGGGWRSRILKDVYGPGEIGRSISWNKLSDREKRFQAKKMEVHAAMIDRMDDEIGRVLDQIERMGDRENTVVMFLSDNGASAELIERGDGHDPSAPMGSADSYLCLGPGWANTSNTPFRLYKAWVHYGGTATPFILNWPAGLPEDVEGKLRHTPAHTNDILPTMLKITGTSTKRDPKDAPTLPGRSLTPTFTGNGENTFDHAYLFFRHSGHKALQKDGWKLVHRKRNDSWELYNLSTDLNEMNDRSKSHSARVERMKTRWTELNEKFKRQSLKQVRQDK